jgi:hypothetical protein
MRVSKEIDLSDPDRQTMTKWSCGRSTPAKSVIRAKIILAAADRKENKIVA